MIAESSGFFNVSMADVFLTTANILYLICYGVKDVLWLRIFCVTAILTITPYYIWGEGGFQNSCILWNLAFLAINTFWIVVIIRERQPPRMTEHQRRLYSDVFQASCTQQQMLKLLSVAKQKSASVGEKIIRKATQPHGLLMIDHGSANVILGDEMVATLRRGDFAGEMSYLTGEPAVADVVAASNLEYLGWSSQDLERLFDGRPELKSAFNEIIGRDLVGKLTTSAGAVPELSVESVVIDRS